MKKNDLLGQCIAEFIGTGLLIFFGVGCVAALILAGTEFGQWEISIIWGLGVSMAIYVTVGVSGAHLNPAVTLALASFKGFDKKKVLPYILSQIAGAFSSTGLVYYLYRDLFINFEAANKITRGTLESMATARIFSTYPNSLLNNFQAFAVEIVITTILMLTILAVGDDKNGTPKGHMSAILIGIVVALIGGSLGALTGFAMNPARDFGAKLFAFVAGWGKIAFTGGLSNPYFWVPILGPICGTHLGIIIYDKMIAVNLVNSEK